MVNEFRFGTSYVPIGKTGLPFQNFRLSGDFPVGRTKKTFTRFTSQPEFPGICGKWETTPVNRIIKITHAHNLHVKVLVFVPFTIRTGLLQNLLKWFKKITLVLQYMYLQLNYASCNVKVDSLTFISFQENYQTAEIYFYSYHVYHSIKQYVIILLTSFFQIKFLDHYRFDLSYVSLLIK